MSEKDTEALGLEEPLDRKKLLDYMRKFSIMPYWTEDRGLTFRPHIGMDARRRFQEVLHLHGKEDVQRLRIELRVSVSRQQRSAVEDDQADLKEDEIENEVEKKTEARKRTRGPYRKSASFP